MNRLTWSVEVTVDAAPEEQKWKALKLLRQAIDQLEQIPSSVIRGTLGDLEPGSFTGGRVGAPHTEAGGYVDGWKGLWQATVVE